MIVDNLRKFNRVRKLLKPEYSLRLPQNKLTLKSHKIDIVEMNGMYCVLPMNARDISEQK